VAPAFVCRQLTKRYGATTALAGVDLEVEPGELLGLLGPNGAGKSTLTKIACGLVRASSGHAEVEGAPAGSMRARSAIGYLAELFRFPDWLSADELLGLHQSLSGSEGGARERTELLELVELDHAQATRVDAMSKGMQQRLGIAQALVGRPRLLMLDEPTSALDPVGRRIVRDLLTGVRDRGVAVVLSSHLLSEVELVCDRVAILNGGRIVARGTPAELARPHGVEIRTGSELLSYPRAAREDVPGIVAALVAQGEEIYEVRFLSSTLEDAYLEAVGAGHVATPAPAEDAA
jgi:ABC-2 type transport system ATP-binding protein